MSFHFSPSYWAVKVGLGMFLATSYTIKFRLKRLIPILPFPRIQDSSDLPVLAKFLAQNFRLYESFIAARANFFLIKFYVSKMTNRFALHPRKSIATGMQR